MITYQSHDMWTVEDQCDTNIELQMIRTHLLDQRSVARFQSMYSYGKKGMIGVRHVALTLRSRIWAITSYSSPNSGCRDSYSRGRDPFQNFVVILTTYRDGFLIQNNGDLQEMILSTTLFDAIQ